jgi:hypothetical protein
MTPYRVYYCDARGKVFAAADFDAGNDAGAIARGAALVSDSAPIFEIWQRDRFIHRHPTNAAALSVDELLSLEQAAPDGTEIR